MTPLTVFRLSGWIHILPSHITFCGANAPGTHTHTRARARHQGLLEDGKDRTLASKSVIIGHSTSIPRRLETHCDSSVRLK